MELLMMELYLSMEHNISSYDKEKSIAEYGYLDPMTFPDSLTYLESLIIKLQKKVLELDMRIEYLEKRDNVSFLKKA